MARLEWIRVLFGDEPLLPAKTKLPPKPDLNAWFRSLATSRPNTDRGVDMNDIAGTLPERQPPRAPGQQQRRWNGQWWYYS